MTTDTDVLARVNETREIVMVELPSVMELAIRKKYPRRNIKRDSWISLMKKVTKGKGL